MPSNISSFRPASADGMILRDIKNALRSTLAIQTGPKNGLDEDNNVPALRHSRHDSDSSVESVTLQTPIDEVLYLLMDSGTLPATSDPMEVDECTRLISAMTVVGVPARDDTSENCTYLTMPSESHQLKSFNLDLQVDMHDPIFDAPFPGLDYDYDMSQDYHLNPLSTSSLMNLPPADATSGWAPSNTFTLTSRDTIMCRWGGCGAVMKRVGTSIREHIATEHPYQCMAPILTSGQSKVCRWVDCGWDASGDFVKHLDNHYGTEAQCKVCFEVLSCLATLEQHYQTTSNCKTCKLCGLRSETVNMHNEHSLMCFIEMTV